jgi:hypothetical protein
MSKLIPQPPLKDLGPGVNALERHGSWYEAYSFKWQLKHPDLPVPLETSKVYEKWLKEEMDIERLLQFSPRDGGISGIRSYL